MFVILSLLTESMLHLRDRCFYSCLWITDDLRCQKRLWILCFFNEVNQNLKKPRFLRFVAFTS